mmetsp:Transcript_8219/g.17981  ORF Transcript_8219/g.17981 Transcript_8219/m.17981 type:complete len:198 (+) Transcript_8219:21-614(+)
MAIFPHKGAIVALRDLPEGDSLEGAHGIVSSVGGSMVTVRVKVGNSIRVVEAPRDSVRRPDDDPVPHVPALPSDVQFGAADSPGLPASTGDADFSGSLMPRFERVGCPAPGFVEETLASLREEAATIAGEEDERCRQQALQMLQGLDACVRVPRSGPDLSGLDDSDEDEAGEVAQEALRWLQDDCGSPAAWSTAMLR